MKIRYDREKIGDGIHFTTIINECQKTNTLIVRLVTELTQDKAALNAVIPYVLSDSSSEYKSITELNRKLSELYGASLRGAVSKLGDSQVISLMSSCINDRYTFDGETVTLSPSQGVNQLHGGPEGFDKRRWQIVNQNDRQVLFALSSDDGDQGFPGNLGATVQYRLTDDNRISITYRATVDKPCPVNMTNHVYFNLDGEQSDVRNHKLQILADEYLPVDEGGIPHDGLKSVAGTSFDFRSAKIIASEFLADDDQRKVKGYDHAFLLQAKGDGKKVAAHVWSADEKLQLKVYTTAPALQFYSGNFLGGTPSRGTEPYADWQGLALESEFLPDSPNHPEWPQPDCFLRPGEEYSSLTEYQFIAE